MGFFVLSFEDENSWESYNRYYLPSVKIKDYNLTIDGRNFFDQPVKKDLRAYDNSQKKFDGSRQWLHFCVFTRLSLFQKMLQTSCNRFNLTTSTSCWSERNKFTGNLDRAEGATISFIIEETTKKKTFLIF